MSMDNPDISMLKRETPKPPERCPSCNALMDPHNGDCRCSN